MDRRFQGRVYFRKIFHSGNRSISETVLKVKYLFLLGAMEEPLLNKVSLEFRKCEVLGIYGLLGAGRSEVLESIMELHESASGQIVLSGELLGESDR